MQSRQLWKWGQLLPPPTHQPSPISSGDKMLERALLRRGQGWPSLWLCSQHCPTGWTPAPQRHSEDTEMPAHGARAPWLLPLRELQGEGLPLACWV